MLRRLIYRAQSWNVLRNPRLAQILGMRGKYIRILYTRTLESESGERRKMRLSPSWCTLLSMVFFWSLLGVYIHSIEGARPLYFQLHVSQQEDSDKSGYIPAINLALNLINDNSSILPEYELMYTDIVDSGVRHYYYILFYIHHCSLI